jgi:hypothetical protein
MEKICNHCKQLLAFSLFNKSSAEADGYSPRCRECSREFSIKYRKKETTKEKEVLCHLGYVVEGIAGCELPTPLAIDDVIAFPENNTPVCINPLQNDESFSGGNLTINSLAPVSLEPGDLIIYYPNVNCNGSILSSASGARSLFFTPTASTESRVMKYTNKDSVSSRISLSAPIVWGSEDCANSPRRIGRGNAARTRFWFFCRLGKRTYRLRSNSFLIF